MLIEDVVLAIYLYQSCGYIKFKYDYFSIVCADRK